MTISPLAGKPATKEMLVDPKLAGLATCGRKYRRIVSLIRSGKEAT